MSIRDEVAQAISGAVPEPKRQEVISRVEKILERRSGPIPDPHLIAQIEALVPGAAKQILEESLKEMQHRREIEKRELDLQQSEIYMVTGISKGEFASVSQGRWIGAVAYFVCFCFAAGFYQLGSEKLALVCLGTAALGVVGQLIRGAVSRQSVRIDGVPTSSNLPTPPKPK